MITDMIPGDDGGGSTPTRVPLVIQMHITELSQQPLIAGIKSDIENLNATITPSSVNSKIKVSVKWQGEPPSSNNENTVFGIRRNGVAIGEGPVAGDRLIGIAGLAQGYFQADSNTTQDSAVYSYIDSPNSTSPIVYTATIISSNTGTLNNNRTGSDADENYVERLTSTIILEEILDSNSGSGGVQSVTGTIVNNVDPSNPIIEGISSVKVEFDSLNARFFGELGLHTEQGFITEGTGLVTSIVNATVFGETKQVLHYTKTGSGAAGPFKTLVQSDIQNMIDFGAEFSLTFNVESILGGLLTNLQFGLDRAENPLDPFDRRIALLPQYDNGFYVIEPRGCIPSDIIQLSIPQTEYLNLALKIIPNPSAITIGDLTGELYVNGKLIKTFTSVFTDSATKPTGVTVELFSTAQIVNIDNFGITIFEESNIKTLTVLDLQKNKIDVFIPEGRRDYTIIFSDTNTDIGTNVELIAQNTGGNILLKTENDALPKTIFNGLNNLLIPILDKSTISLINTVDQGSTYITEGQKTIELDNALKEEGQIKLNFTGLELVGFTDSVTKYFDIDASTITVSSDTRYPHSSSTSTSKDLFDNTRSTDNPVGIVGKLVENPLDLQAQTWRILGTFSNKQANNNIGVDIGLYNPTSTFHTGKTLTLPSNTTTGDIEIILITIADTASIPSPNGYVLSVVTTVTDNNLTFNIDSITRITGASLRP